MSEHDWEKLYTLRPSLYQQADPHYAGLDLCSRCGALRRLVEDTMIYKPSSWAYNTDTEPPCKEE